MEDLRPEDRELIGMYLDLGSKIVTDAVWDRIDWLVNERLEKLAEHPDGLDTLYRDPADGRLWERNEAWKGGQPRLRTVTADDARTKYGVS